VWIFDAGTADLGDEEDGARYEEAPEAGHAELFDDEVGSDTL